MGNMKFKQRPREEQADVDGTDGTWGCQPRSDHFEICFFLFSLSVYGCSFQDNLSYEQHFERGTKYFESKKLDKAINEYKKALKLNPSAAEAHYYLGLAYEQKWSDSFEAAAKKYTEEMIRISQNSTG